MSLRVGEGRPYPPTGLTTKRWEMIQPELVSWNNVTTTQRHVSIEAILDLPRRVGPRSTDRYPHIVEYRGVLYLEDGHNRMVRDLLAGKTSTLARIYLCFD